MSKKSTVLAFAASLTVINAFGQFVPCNGPASPYCTASNLGIGSTTNTPTNNLHIFTSGGAALGLTIEGANPAVRFQSSGGTPPQGYFGLATSATAYFSDALANDLIIRSEANRILMGGLAAGASTLAIDSGKIGVGTSHPSSALHVFTNTAADGLLIEGSNNPSAALKSNGSNRGYLAVATTAGSYFTNSSVYDLILRSETGMILIGQYAGQTTPVTLAIANGHVGIGTLPSTTYTLDVAGTIHAAQVIGATYGQDVAEWVPTTTKMSPGTVVVVQRGAKNTVIPSAAAYATSVAGVVSERPGLILGESSESKAMIATTGRVKVHVDASSGAIEAGDLLVTSGKSGVAMKSQPVDLGGVKIHRPGTLIGKALESLSCGEGDILVLLSLQ
jgi:hypothetical protein